MRGMYRVLVRKPDLEDPGVDGRLILRWIFRKWNGVYRLDLSGSE
jgi:hypothetical protein